MATACAIPRGKVALRKIKEIVETVCVGKYATKLLLVHDMGKELRHRHNSMHKGSAGRPPLPGNVIPQQ